MCESFREVCRQLRQQGAKSSTLDLASGLNHLLSQVKGRSTEVEVPRLHSTKM
jgi:hypothetical protein